MGTELDECFSYRSAYRATRPTLLSTVTADDWISLWTFYDTVSSCQAATESSSGRNSHLQVCRMVIIAGQTLFDFADLQKVLRTDSPAELRD